MDMTNDPVSRQRTFAITRNAWHLKTTLTLDSDSCHRASHRLPRGPLPWEASRLLAGVAGVVDRDGLVRAAVQDVAIAVDRPLQDAEDKRVRAVAGCRPVGIGRKRTKIIIDARPEGPARSMRAIGVPREPSPTGYVPRKH